MRKIPLKKRFSKKDKEINILLGLIDLYIKTNHPIGSNSLKESGFDYMSSATIRNYFVKLEKNNYLKQQHASGGRIPTTKAYNLYVKKILESNLYDKKAQDLINDKISIKESNKIMSFLNDSSEILSNISKCPVFQSSPRFDQDFIEHIKLIQLEENKLLCVIITAFGVIKQEIIKTNQINHESDLKKIEDFFLWQLNKKNKPNIENKNLLKTAQNIYSEIMVRYIIGYSNFILDDIYKTGISKLLTYSEFSEPNSLSESLSIFENPKQMQAILNTCIKKNDLTYFLGEDLEKFDIKTSNAAVLAYPYYINQTPIGQSKAIAPIGV